MKKIFIILTASVVIAAMVLSGCVMVVKNNPTKAPETSATPYVTCAVSTAPDQTAAVTTAAPATDASDTAFVQFTTKTLDGKPFDQTYFAQYKITFINYWGTWCGPCVGELPDLEKLYQKYKGAVGFIGICDDVTVANTDNQQLAVDILGKSGDTYINVMNFNEVADIYGQISAVPNSIIVDSTGKPVSEQIVGAIGNDKYAEYIDKALAEAK
jgi:thiol-disulfide isomerase/thioredoxin